MDYDQKSAKPVPKVAAVGIAGVAVSLVVAVLAGFGVIVPGDVSSQAEAGIAAIIVVVSAVQAVVQFAAGYFKKDKKEVL